jgi:hypothetical protein
MANFPEGFLINGLVVPLLPERLPPELPGGAVANMQGMNAIAPLEMAELRYLQRARVHHGGERKLLSGQLGITERMLYRKLALPYADPFCFLAGLVSGSSTGRANRRNVASSSTQRSFSSADSARKARRRSSLT